MPTEYFYPGAEIVLRRVWKGRVYRVTAVTVVKDTPDCIALYWGPGYPLKSATTDPLTVHGLSHIDLVGGTWGGRHVLCLADPTAGHAVYAFWDEAHRLLQWYINLQEPLYRTRVGFDTTDYLLDIAVSPDRATWVWQDEDDFDAAIAAGNISSEQAYAIRNEGERAVRLVQSGPSSFYDRWANWSPPRDWRIPVLPSGCEEI